MSNNHSQIQYNDRRENVSTPSNKGCSIKAYIVGDVQHVALLAENIGNLYGSNECSDVTLKVEGCLIPAHRIILAARSEYFRALFFNGMRETKDSEIELVDTPLKGFTMLLSYIYTAKITLSLLSEDLILEMLGLAHKYGFTELETSISEYLKLVLNEQNVCAVFDAANLYSLKSLCEVCLNYADKYAPSVVSSPGFLQLSASAVEQMIRRDSFCALEIDIFKAVKKWVQLHSDQTKDAEMIISRLRLSLIKLDDLLNVVRNSGLVTGDAILDAIKEQNEKRSGEMNYRGVLFPNINVVSADFDAIVLTGESTNGLLSGDTNRSDTDRGFATHAISDRNPGIIIQLARPHIINHIRLLLWDRDQRSYNYFIEVSMDREDWVRVIDHTKYLCRSRQKLFFPQRVVNYIRIGGTYNSVNNAFHMVSIEAMYSTEFFEVDPLSTLLIPKTNVATISNNAVVIEGVSRSRNALINGETKDYDWDNGYTCHQLGSGAIVVQLPQPYLIDSMRLLLWDCDDRHYSYYVEVSCDNVTWVRVADKTQEECRAWQLLRFEQRPVVFIRLVGTHNSANEVFHCVHFECPADPSAIAENLEATSEAAEGRGLKE